MELTLFCPCGVWFQLIVSPLLAVHGPVAQCVRGLVVLPGRPFDVAVPAPAGQVALRPEGVEVVGHGVHVFLVGLIVQCDLGVQQVGDDLVVGEDEDPVVLFVPGVRVVVPFLFHDGLEGSVFLFGAPRWPSALVSFSSLL